jgi:hypothetical protein
MTNTALHIMIDLETLGTTPGSVVLSIGAVKFDPSDITTPLDELDKFHVAITPGSTAGLTCDPQTVAWWMHPDRDEARAALRKVPEADLYTALDGLTQWAQEGNTPVTAWWGNSAAFDLGILGATYKHVGMEQPWKFWEERCYRTIKGCFAVAKSEMQGTAHSALDDAIQQVKVLRWLYSRHDGLAA